VGERKKKALREVSPKALFYRNAVYSELLHLSALPFVSEQSLIRALPIKP